MSKVRIEIDVQETAATVDALLRLNSGGPRTGVERLASWISGLVTGFGAAMRVVTGAVKATGTLTFTGASVADETMTIAGVTFTAKASGATGNQFNIGGTVTLSAESLVSAVNASSDTNKIVVASNVAGVVTFTCKTPGSVGNAIGLTEGLTNATVSGALLTGGLEGTDTSMLVGRATV